MGEEILILVIQRAPREQLADWLRLPHEVSAGDDQAWSLLSKRNECCQFRRQGEKLLSIVMEKAPREQWIKWLQIPLEHASLAGRGGLVQKLRAAAAAAAGAASSTGEPMEGSPAASREQPGSSRACASEVELSGAMHEARDAIAIPAAGASLPEPAPSPPRENLEGSASSPTEGVASTNACCSEADLLAAAAAAAAAAAYNPPTRPPTAPSVCCEPAVNPPSGVGAHAAGALPSDAASVAARADEQLALHRATMAGDVNRMRELLAAGIDKNATDLWSCTALHRAAEQDFAEAVRLLIASGMDVRARDMEGYTPLHFAAARGACTSLVDLLDAGACVRDRGQNGDTPLHSAVRFLSLSTALILLDWDSDERSRNTSNETPRDVTGVLPDGREIENAPDPAAAQRIMAALSEAPERRRFRTWKRRAWLVMLRARRLAWIRARQRGEPPGKKKEAAFLRPGPDSTAARGRGQDGAVSSRQQLEKPPPQCRSAGSSVAAAQRTIALLRLVKRVTELPEDGIFQKVTLFL